MAIKPVLQPDGSSLCGQACVAMAAGVSLKRAIEAVGHEKKRGTYTREVIAALRSLDIQCADACRKVSRKRPVLPRRGLVVIHRPKLEGRRRSNQWHWLLTWDGKIYDPSGWEWPDGYKDWKITSYLEIS